MFRSAIWCVPNVFLGRCRRIWPGIAGQPRLAAASVRYRSRFRLGGLSNPDAGLRAEAVALTIAGGRVAERLGARELVVTAARAGQHSKH